MSDDRVIGESGEQGAGSGAGDEVRPDEEPAKLPHHIAAALCYVLSFASGVVFLLLEPDDRSIRFHAFQSILLGVIVITLQIGIWILGWVPPLGLLVGDLLRWIVGFGWVIVTLVLMAKAFGGEDYQLPYLGPRAAKLARPYE